MEIHRILTGLIFLTLSGCTAKEEIWKSHLEVSEAGWAYGQILETEWTPEEDIPGSQLLIDVIHSGDFKYQNLYLTGQVKTDESDHLRQDTFSMQLATPNSGRWRGDRISENQIRKTDTIGLLPPIRKGQTLRLSLQQFSRDSILTEISEIGWRIIPAKDEGAVNQ